MRGIRCICKEAYENFRAFMAMVVSISKTIHSNCKFHDLGRLLIQLIFKMKYHVFSVRLFLQKNLQIDNYIFVKYACKKWCRCQIYYINLIKVYWCEKFWPVTIWNRIFLPYRLRNCIFSFLVQNFLRGRLIGL